MTTRRGAMGWFGAGAAAWMLGVPGLAAALSRAVPLDDPDIKVTENIWIPMADGVRLAARLFLPADAMAKPAGVVLEYLPYRKRDGYRYRDDIVGPILAKAGIGFIRVDIRGTGESDGTIIDEYMPVEQADALFLIDWIARQPWCNGRVGMRGISYGSFTALQAAAKAPAALKAIVSTCGTEQRYVEDVHYRGGCLIQNQFDWAMEWQVVMRAPPDPAIVGEDRWRPIWRERLEASRSIVSDWNQHQRDDAYWKNASTQDYGKIRCAVFNVAGMLDSYLDSAVRMMEQANVPQRALIGPWAHKWPGYPDPPGHAGALPSDAANGTPGPGVDWMPIEVRWWRHWLNGEANGIMDEPRVWAFREDLPPLAAWPHDTPGTWVAEPRWPSSRLEPQVFHLNADGLSREAGPERLLEHRTNLTVGLGGRTSDGSGEPESWWREQSGDDALSLTFDTPPLAAPLDVMGQPVFTIRVRADKPVAKLYARLCEVTPDGRSHYVSYGLLNLTHRDSDEAPSPLEPGRDYDVSFKGQFACYRFSAGSRVRVALSETWWPVAWPSPEMVVLHVTAGASRVALPVRDAAGVDPPAPFGVWRDRYAADKAGAGLYDAGRLQGVTVEGEVGRRTYTLVEGSDQVTPEPVAGIGTVYGEAYRLRRTIREDDPNSAEMEALAINSYDRGDWSVKLRAWTLCRSTPTQFIVAESFEAWDGGKPVFSRRWERTIPRDLV
ncbi:MAG: CocE/NonD family hydrolase [Caulobacteraceae bacterium]|nr:CocE/NonD family hydrolase [Caulobacteraceae bacterium]